MLEKEIFTEEVLKLLLTDRTTGKNIIWANDTETHKATDEITLADVDSIQPRRMKTIEEKVKRSKNKAEVFTPSWVCNCQNNLVDDDYLKQKGLFNKEIPNGWETNYNKIVFPKGMHWTDYVRSTRLEITCGEAPYLTSRFDAVTGKYIEPKDRIGLLDRKLRVVSENTFDSLDWMLMSRYAIHSIYGYDFQGDNVFLARKNLLMTIVEHYKDICKGEEKNESMFIYFIEACAEIISWNIWQMDGLRGVVPFTCSSECKACKNKDVMKVIKNHDGLQCKIMDWDINSKEIKFVDMMSDETGTELKKKKKL